MNALLCCLIIFFTNKIRNWRLVCQGEILKGKVKQKMNSICIKVSCYAHTCRQTIENERFKNIMCQIGGSV